VGQHFKDDPTNRTRSSSAPVLLRHHIATFRLGIFLMTTDCFSLANGFQIGGNAKVLFFLDLVVLS
jgi:hypothetical protein